MFLSSRTRRPDISIADFIEAHREAIVTEWMAVADDLTKRDLTPAELRDAVREMLGSIVDALRASGSTHSRQIAPDAAASHPITTPELPDAAKAHASHRFAQRFTLKQMTAEYRALRANITRRWLEAQKGKGKTRVAEELSRFNAAVDVSLASAVAWYDDQLRERQEELRLANRNKNEFLAVLGHELRNPLAPLRTGLDLLQRARAKPELLDSLGPMMERQFSHLSRLVDDLLDFARISRGEIALHVAPIDLNAAIEAAIEQLVMLIDERRHSLEVQLSQAPLRVLGDFDRLTQAVANLLSNANKYMEPGGKITVGSREEDGNAVVTVTDTGYGIPPDKLATVFELFTQIPEHREKTGGGGLGIGLALARRLLEMHSGSIEARSRGLSHGSELVVMLPLAHTTEAQQGADNTDLDAEVRSGHRVLIVDDNEDAADSLGMLVRLMGASVRTAYDGESALNEIAAFKPEVVFLDIGLPGMSGLDAARKIRAMPGGSDIALIAITGWSQTEDMRQTREAGFDNHLVKPVDAKAIHQLLARLQQKESGGD